MHDFHCSPPENDKKLHYELTKEHFRESALHKDGYYDAKKRGKLKHDIWQRKIWDICISMLDKLLQNSPEIMRVIDIGCGRGDFTIELAKRYPQFEEIVGIDFLREAIGIARKNAKQFDKVSFKRENLLNIPFKDKNFDLTICINLLHHVHIDDFNKAIEELTRITDKYLILEIRNKKNIFNFWYDTIVLPYFYRDIPIFTNSISEISNILKKHNFMLQTSRGVFPHPYICRRLVLIYKRNDIR